MAPPIGSLAQARDVMQRHFAHRALRVPQLRVLGPLLAGHDVLAVLPTGAGKSLCYQIPALLAPGLSLVVSPLVSLMQDQASALQARGVLAACLHGHLSGERRRTILDAALHGTLRILMCAPERLDSLVSAVRSSGRRVALFAVDEAHCIAEWGNAFRPVYRRLGIHRLALGRPLTLALTGSATPAVRREILEVLRLDRAEVVVTSFDRPNLWFGAERVADDRERFARLRRHLAAASGPALVYAPTRRLTELVTRSLLRLGVRAAPYHAALSAGVRAKVLRGFLSGEARVVVATSAFGMGIDKPDVRLVAHWEPPRTLEAYYQEAGRAGRDGAPSRCVILWRPHDLRSDTIGDPVRRYVATRHCRRRMLLEYFGESLERCSGCDACR